MTSRAPNSRIAVVAPLQGNVVAISAHAGDLVGEGSALVVIESMKME